MKIVEMANVTCFQYNGKIPISSCSLLSNLVASSKPSIMIFLFAIYLFFLFLSTNRASNVHKQPHIIVITADDMGWNDVSFHGTNVFKTPNIDALAYHGIILNDFHSSSLCTPSRSALMTGDYPVHLGTQQLVILEAEPTGLRLDRKLLPEYMKCAGYSTHLIGKWHLGSYKKVYTPTKRGFDSFYGYWNGHQDYFTHCVEETFGPLVGYDMREDLETDWTTRGQYSTDIFTHKAVDLIENHDAEQPLFLYLSQIAPHAGTKTDPLQVPKEDEEKFNYISDPDKRKYAAMLYKLDESVGKVVKALKNKNMLENCVILFMSDNGAPTVGIYATGGSNYPFRGIKGTEWEGGTRVPAVIWSPLFPKQQKVSNMMMHMVDVLPTLCHAAGINAEKIGKIDGQDMWPSLVAGAEKSSRTGFIYNIDPAGKDNSTGAIRMNDWKYIKGSITSVGPENGWYDINDLESNFNDSSYNTSEVIHSLVSQSIESLHPKDDCEQGIISVFLRYLSWLPECSSFRLTPEKIHDLRNQSKIRCPEDKYENTKRPSCKLYEGPCLINLKEDPCERYNFADENPQKFKEMQKLFEKYRQKVVPPMNKPRDENADPRRYNGTWANWGDLQKPAKGNEDSGQFYC